MKKLEDYLGLQYSIEVVPEVTTDGSLCYMASHPELPGCMSHGDTPEEAIANLEEAKELYIKVLLEKGQQVPLPKEPKIPSMTTWVVASVGEEIEEESIAIAPSQVNPILPLETAEEEMART